MTSSIKEQDYESNFYENSKIYGKIYIIYCIPHENDIKDSKKNELSIIH